MKGVIIFFLVGLISCNNKKPIRVSNPPGYDLQKPTVVKLPLELDEISGLAYYASDKSIFAISDEKGKLFKITPFPKLSLNLWRFSTKADFEDLVLLDSTFYVLQSNGRLNKVQFITSDTINNIEVDFPADSKMEFEAMFYNPVTKVLELICKKCVGEKKKFLNIYTFDPARNAFADSSITFDISDLFIKMDEKKFDMRISGAAVHPLTGDIYLISAINKLLVILDKDHVVKSSYPLNSGMFKQPEGITFATNGTLIISNESADAGAANLLVFNYKK